MVTNILTPQGNLAVYMRSDRLEEQGQEGYDRLKLSGRPVATNTGSITLILSEGGQIE
jgi:hypothetical protein